MSTLIYFTMLQYIINCGLRIAFRTTTLVFWKKVVFSEKNLQLLPLLNLGHENWYMCRKNDWLQNEAFNDSQSYSGSPVGAVELQGKFEANIFPSLISKLNCALCIALVLKTHSDHERSRVGLQLCEVKMRLTAFLEIIKRATDFLSERHVHFLNF